MPGPPTDVKVQPVNSTTIHVQWRPPTEEDRHGIIRGYHIHVQEAKPEVPTPPQHINPGTFIVILSVACMIFINIFRDLG